MIATFLISSMITNHMSGVNDGRYYISNSLVENSDDMSTIVFKSFDLHRNGEKLYI